MSIRTKRNFKNLQLPAASLGPNEFHKPAPTRLAPLAPRKRPPSLRGHLTSEDSSLAGPAPDTLSNKAFDLKNGDFRTLEELGQGKMGSVTNKVQHVPSKKIMAQKIVLIDANTTERKKILRELQVMRNCDSPYIIASYGAYLAEPNLCICMEFMDKKSFDRIYKSIGAIDIKVVGKVAVAVLEGLKYLEDVHRIIHCNIKPSNILCNSAGEIKLCDFHVSGKLINFVANTFVGTPIYMSPERIQGGGHSVKSDIWSLGITLLELSVGQFPFPESLSESENDSESDCDLENVPPTPSNHRDSLQVSMSATNKRRRRMSIIELMHQIINGPSPKLPPGKFGQDPEDFVDGCLEKDPDARRTPAQLLDYAWLVDSRNNGVDMKAWAATF